MGRIYLAAEESNDGQVLRHLAIKTVRPHLSENPEFVTMFLDEVSISAQLTHPNIVQIYNFGKDEKEDVYYLSMELVKGMNLREMLGHCKAHDAHVPPELAAFIISEVCRALDYAHNKQDINGKQLNIIHRDISPANIMISHDGAVKILDFGVAKASSRIMETVSGQVKGKYSYMSPEQITGKPLDNRSDLFSLGIVFFELLTNVNLFRGETDAETITRIQKQKITPPSKKKTGLPKKLDSVVIKALERDPKKRFDSARNFYDTLQPYINENVANANTYGLSSFVDKVLKGELGNINDETRIFNYQEATGQTTPTTSILSSVRSKAKKSSWIIGSGLVIVILIAIGYFAGNFLSSRSSDQVAAVTPVPVEITPPPQTPTPAKKPEKTPKPTPEPTPEPTPVVEPAVTQKGTLIVHVSPPVATVYIDKKGYSVTNGKLIKEFDKPRDKLIIQAKSKKSSWQYRSTPIELGKSHSVWFKLVDATPTPAPEPTPEPTPEATPVPKGDAFIAVRSTPWTYILLNGVSVGQTPKAKIKGKTGANKITLINKTYGINWSTTVTPVSGKPAKVDKRFMGTLIVLTESTSLVSINGVQYGSGKVTANIAAGKYTVRITNNNTGKTKPFPGVLKFGETKTVSAYIQ